MGAKSAMDSGQKVLGGGGGGRSGGDGDAGEEEKTTADEMADVDAVRVYSNGRGSEQFPQGILSLLKFN